MKKAVLLALVLSNLTLPGRPASLAGEPIVAIVNVNAVALNGRSLQPGMTVLVRGQRIAGIGNSGHVKVPAEARIVDGRGKFLIPGLWDMHVHIALGDWVPGGKEVALPLFVANGITGIREMGGDLDTL